MRRIDGQADRGEREGKKRRNRFREKERERGRMKEWALFGQSIIMPLRCSIDVARESCHLCKPLLRTDFMLSLVATFLNSNRSFGSLNHLRLHAIAANSHQINMDLLITVVPPITGLHVCQSRSGLCICKPEIIANHATF